MVAGIGVSLFLWSGLARKDRTLFHLYIAALLGAMTGAKVLYLIAEGWQDWPQPDRWLRLASGKTILGGLIGGWLAVEGMKNCPASARPRGTGLPSSCPWGVPLGGSAASCRVAAPGRSVRRARALP
jgi:phosphatidylglycerol:prolipoprotein diacylglycerol transferase